MLGKRKTIILNRYTIYRHPGWKHCRIVEAKRIKRGNNPVYKQWILQASAKYKDTTIFADMFIQNICFYNLQVYMIDFCLKRKSGIRNVLFSHPYVEIEEMGVGTLHPEVFYGCDN